MQMRLIFTKKVLHLASFWKWEFSLFHLHFSRLHLNGGNCYRELKQRRRRRRRRQRQRELQKSNGVRLAKQQLCTCITLFCTFPSRRCTTTTWKCLISRFVEDGNTKQQLFFSFPELWYSPLEFNSNKFANMWRVKRNEISAKKFEAARIHILSDILVAVAVVV